MLSFKGYEFIQVEMSGDVSILIRNATALPEWFVPGKVHRFDGPEDGVRIWGQSAPPPEVKNRPVEVKTKVTQPPPGQPKPKPNNDNSGCGLLVLLLILPPILSSIIASRSIYLYSISPRVDVSLVFSLLHAPHTPILSLSLSPKQARLSSLFCYLSLVVASGAARPSLPITFTRLYASSRPELTHPPL